MSDDEVEAVNRLQEAPSTSLTSLPLAAYEKAKRTIERWDPFHGATVRAMEMEEET